MYRTFSDVVRCRLKMNHFFPSITLISVCLLFFLSSNTLTSCLALLTQPSIALSSPETFPNVFVTVPLTPLASPPTAPVTIPSPLLFLVSLTTASCSHCTPETLSHTSKPNCSFFINISLSKYAIFTFSSAPLAVSAIVLPNPPASAAFIRFASMSSNSLAMFRFSNSKMCISLEHFSSGPLISFSIVLKSPGVSNMAPSFLFCCLSMTSYNSTPNAFLRVLSSRSIKAISALSLALVAAFPMESKKPILRLFSSSDTRDKCIIDSEVVVALAFAQF
mmetsp:Transcript_100907/g.151207  ORF Transcript_100907/g.151207 Transcript_100907/m.151207 type:complete len:277 (+) Transcript_100907:241-1071(+)